MLTNLRDSVVKRVLKSEEQCKTFNTDGAGSHSGDHQCFFLLALHFCRLWSVDEPTKNVV